MKISDSTDKAVVAAEEYGRFALPAMSAIAYAIYIFVFYGPERTNAWILVLLGLATLFTVGAAKWWALLAPTLLGLYQFGMIGIVALVLAISESSSWSSLLFSVFWILLGWRFLTQFRLRESI